MKWFLYTTPPGTVEANIPRSGNGKTSNIVVYVKKDFTQYVMSIDTSDPITLQTLVSDPGMAEITEAEYDAYCASPDFKKAKKKGEA